jgi:tripartite-type tricarboxylate transporter receptor subunit TctC
MEALLEKVHKSARWREYAVNNLYEDRWMGAAEFTTYLAQQRTAQREFVDAIGLGKK